MSGFLFSGELNFCIFEDTNFFFESSNLLILWANSITEISLSGDPILKIFFVEFLLCEIFKINSSILSKSETYSETDSPDGKTIEEFILNAKNYDLKYVISNEKPGVLHPITDKLYDNYEKYPFLKKIFDSNEHGFQKLKIKVFEIDYKKFHEFVK